MNRVQIKVCGLIVAYALVWAVVPAIALAQEGAKKEPASAPAELIRKALDQDITLDYSGPTLQEALNHLKQKTKVDFVLDLFTLQQMGIGFEDNPSPVQIKIDKGKVRLAVQRLLSPYNLTYVILGDSVLITTEEMGIYRQMRQRVHVDVDNVPLKTALRELARRTGLSLVIDPRTPREADAAVSLQLDDATLETAVRLLAEIGGLKAVRMGNVLFVTAEARADKIRKEEAQPVNPADPRLQIGSGVVGGFGGAGMAVPGVIGGAVPPANFPRVAPERGAPGNVPPPPASDRPPQAPSAPPGRVPPPRPNAPE